MLLRMPAEIRFLIYTHLAPQHVRHVVVSLTQRSRLISESDKNILQVCRTIRAEFLPVLYAKLNVEIHAHPYHHAWPIRRNGLAYTYHPSGQAPWAMNMLEELGSDVRLLGQLKVVQKLSGSHTVRHSTVWTQPLRALLENLRSHHNIEFEPETPGLLLPDVPSNLSQVISTNMLIWSWDNRDLHYLQVRVPRQRGPEIIFEYQLEWMQGEVWSLRKVEKLCDAHRAIWRVPGQRFSLY